MKASDLKRLEELFQRAADLSGKERVAFLDRECATAPEARAHLEAILAQHDRDETLEAPSVLADQASAGPVEEAGSLIDRYKLLQVIGEGGFGVVYMAEQQEPVVRKVALKVIKVGMDTREVIARFEAERQALAMMDHPSIAKVLDGGATGSGRPYFVMELVRGVSITEYCDQNNLSTRERLELFAEVCRAVQHAHQKGVIHRDIKPSNVMVTLHDGRPVAKVIDFGVAKAMHARLTEKTLFTAYQRFIGTPAYMSPEQAEMSGLDIDTRSDIYSLGVLLYELLTGTTPFESGPLLAAGLLEIQRILREEQPPRPSLRISTSANASTIATRRRLDVQGLTKCLRGDLDWIVMKALEKERTRRYAAASDLAADIHRHLRQLPVKAGPPSTSYRLRKLLARHRAAAVSAVLVGLALVAGVIGTSIGMLEAGRQRDSAQHEAERAHLITEFLVENLELSDPEIALLPEISVRTLLDRAAGEIGVRFADQPEAEAQLRATIGRAYESLGEHQLAEAHLRRAVVLFDQQGISDPADFYDVLWTLVNVAFRLDRDDAFVLVQRARQVGHDHIRSMHPDLAESLDRFLAEVDGGSRSTDPKALESAVRRFAEVEKLADLALEPGDALWLIVADSFLSAGYSLWYNPREALSELFFAKALEIQEQELPAGHPTSAETLGVLAGVLTRAGKAPEAESRIRASLDAMRRIYPPGNFHVAFCESMLGASLVAQGRYAEAEPLLIGSHKVLIGQSADESHFFSLDSYGRVIQLYDGWERLDESRQIREAFAKRIARSKWGAPWPIAQLAFGPADADLKALCERLDQATGGYSFTAIPGSNHSEELEALIEGIVTLRRERLAGSSARAVVLARLLLGWSNTLAPGPTDGVRFNIAKEVLDILNTWQGEVPPLEIAKALALEADTLIARGEIDVAKRGAYEAWALLRDAPTDTSWYTASAKVRIGRVFVHLGLFAEAEALLRPAHQVLTASLTASHAETQEARSGLSVLYETWDKPARLRELAQQQ